MLEGSCLNTINKTDESLRVRLFSLVNVSEMCLYVVLVLFYSYTVPGTRHVMCIKHDLLKYIIIDN